jgi:hypothetical protein
LGEMGRLGGDGEAYKSRFFTSGPRTLPRSGLGWGPLEVAIPCG